MNAYADCYLCGVSIDDELCAGHYDDANVICRSCCELLGWDIDRWTDPEAEYDDEDDDA